MSRRKYIIKHDAGRHLTDRQREILGRAWNQYVNRLVPVSLREFARLHNAPHETWRRKYRRGAAGRTVRRGNRWTYAEYDRAVRRMKTRNALPTVRSVTTDNGCEFLDQRSQDRLFKAREYYTRAYASYEKGTVENCNRLVRRWYPKETDFNSLTKRQIRNLEDTINSIHRESLNGETAYACDSRLAQTN